jgi:hypothetical protein
VLIIGEGSFPPPPTTFYGKLKDKTRAIMVDLHIPNTTKVPGFLTAHIMDPDLPNHPLKLCTPMRCTPMRYTAKRHAPIRYTPVRCMPMRYPPIRCTLVRCTLVRYYGWSICRDLSL